MLPQISHRLASQPPNLLDRQVRHPAKGIDQTPLHRDLRLLGVAVVPQR
jgi:hypothetical protein